MNRSVSGRRGGASPRGATWTRPGQVQATKHSQLRDPEDAGDPEDDRVDEKADRAQPGLHDDRDGQEEERAEALGDPHHAGRDESPLRLREDRAVPGQEVGAADRGGGSGQAHHGRDRDDGDRRRDEMELVEDHDAGQHEPTRLADGEDAERHEAQVAVGAPQERRDQQLRGAEGEREDADHRGGRGGRSQRQQERDGEAVAGQREDGGRGPADPLERAVPRPAECSPLVDGRARAAGNSGTGQVDSEAIGRGHGPMVARSHGGPGPAVQSMVIVRPLPSSSRMSMIGPRRPVRRASRTRSA